MHMKELQNAWRSALAPTTVACVIKEEPTIFTQKGAWLLGGCDAICWQQLHNVAGAVMRLAADILERDLSEFQMCPGFVMEGDAHHARYGIHIDLPGSDAASRAAFQQALGPFAAGILDHADKESMEMFPACELTESLRQKVKAHIDTTLGELKGKKIKMPTGLITGDLSFGLSGRYGEAPPPEIDRTPFEFVGRVEGLDRPERTFRVAVLGAREHLQRVNFDLERFLLPFKSILCDGEVYRFTAHTELDAKSKPIVVVDKVALSSGAPFALTP